VNLWTQSISGTLSFDRVLIQTIIVDYGHLAVVRTKALFVAHPYSFPGRFTAAKKGFPNFTAYSAGSHPKGSVHPAALHQIETAKLPLVGLQSKNWSEFVKPDAPKLDFVITVCDNAAKEASPAWPGQPMTAHWGIPDPAAVEGSPQQIEQAFRGAFITLDRRISLFLCLPHSSLDKLAIKKQIDQIGQQ
jgi:arsenate reductase